MHIQTHLLSGWCFSNVFKLTAKERFFCILAASLPDIDGFGFLISKDLYWGYHHVIAHNIFFILLGSLILTIFSKNRIKAFLIYLGLMHAHLVMDYFGSGYGWQIKYFWPISRWSIWWQDAWPFFGWQNKMVALVFVIWAIEIFIVKKRTFFEWAMPSLDKQFVALLEKTQKTV